MRTPALIYLIKSNVMEKFALIAFIAIAGTVIVYSIVELAKQKRKGNV